MEKIDFVITWVDGNDEKWKKEKNKYYEKKIEGDSSEERFRDWELLKYWFRGVNKFAPWVNQIHFVTYGHIPKWLNKKNPKLNIVSHQDFIPEEYLPTFNSHTIENNMHKIKNLSDKFVYFNDDMFLLKKVKPSSFFYKGKPCDAFIENILTTSKRNDIFPHILLNNMNIVNTNFSKRAFIKKNISKYINYKYGLKNFRTLPLAMWNNFSMIYDFHIPLSFCKNTIDEVWKIEKEKLRETCSHKFRMESDVSLYIFRYWQLLTGNFKPRRCGFGKLMTLGENNDKIYKAIEKQKFSIVCINDATFVDFEKTKEELIESFEKILSEKSSYEI